MSKTDQPAVFLQESQPDWGFGIVLEDRSDKWVLLFERGGRRVFEKRLAKGLKPAELSADEARALDSKLRGRRVPVAASKSAKKKPPSRTPHPPLYASFEAQLHWFEAKFVGGFQGESFVNDERGHPGSKGKKGYKEAAIAFAREQLSPERFKAASLEELFDAAKRVVQFTNIVHPMEGSIAFGSMKAEDRAPFITALGELLHGSGDYGARFERFVDSIPITDAKGKVKKITWPMATILPAMYHPREHVCVKPVYFEQQSLIVGLPTDKSAPPSGPGYSRFLAVALETQKKLIEAGQAPRDLMDVYSFIWLSQSEKRPLIAP
ncbi:hypothetical protein [Hyalangium sp.]|uniref:hypothetical protein n=1 Tax=Hyalangium sp. TaxID=2028555 RepID=UPI002D5FEBC3|nr:hypothetical protein [Hyalangium sp.]HYH99448.1 hypothetical protein [Hyalangium sp.]